MLSDFKTNSDPHGTSKAPHSIIHHPLLVIEFSWYHGTSGASLNHTTSVTITKRTHLHGTMAPAGLI